MALTLRARFNALIWNIYTLAEVVVLPAGWDSSRAGGNDGAILDKTEGLR